MVAALQPAIFPMTLCDLYACWALDQRCFEDGEAYDLSTIRMLLSSSDSVSYKVVDHLGEMKGFLLGLVDRTPTYGAPVGGHIVAVGVAPEARCQGYGRWLIQQAEFGFAFQGAHLVYLEVRVSNLTAYRLYCTLGYTIAEAKPRYYANGEDGLKMIKLLQTAFVEPRD
jgi:ribosomal protein S18 acetylase RimI-like enzyme